MIDLKQVLSIYPTAFESRSKLRAILKDLFPTEIREINLILAVYESGIFNQLYGLSVIDSLHLSIFTRQLMDEYGLQEEYAIKGIDIWANATGARFEKADSHKTSKSPIEKPAVLKPQINPVPLIVGDVSDYEIKELDNETIEIKKFCGFEENTMIIPYQINGKRVVGIGEAAFENCKEMSTVEIPEGVKYIEILAFANCKKLSSVKLPESLERLGRNKPGLGVKGVFKACSLKSIHLPENLSYIGTGAFWGCKFLESINIPNKIEEIPMGCFGGCKSLEKVILPNNLKSIKENAFFDCRSLTELDIPETVTEIGEDAFSNCGSLSNVILKEGLQTIGKDAFSYCDSLRKLIIPRSVSYIAPAAFKKSVFAEPISLLCYAGSYGLTYARDNGMSYENAAKYTS